MPKREQHGAWRRDSPDAPRRSSREYSCWANIKTRCLNPRCKAWDDYGGRGVTICDEWAKSFSAFLAYVGPAPSASHSIDRINGDGNYEPGNVRWATKREQALNRATSQIRPEAHTRTGALHSLDV